MPRSSGIVQRRPLLVCCFLVCWGAACQTPQAESLALTESARKAAVEQRDPGRAIERLHKAVAVNAQNHQALGLLGQFLVEGGKPEEALPLLLSATTLREGHSGYLFTLAKAHALLAVKKGGEHGAAAREVLLATVAADPCHVEALAFLGQTLEETGDVADAIDAYGNALLCGGDDFGAGLRLARVYFDRGFWERAAAIAELLRATRSGDAELTLMEACGALVRGEGAASARLIDEGLEAVGDRSKMVPSEAERLSRLLRRARWWRVRALEVAAAPSVEVLDALEAFEAWVGEDELTEGERLRAELVRVRAKSDH